MAYTVSKVSSMKVNCDVITRERIKRGWTRSDLARHLERHVSSVSRLEKGEYAPPKLIKEVADLFNIPVEQLIGS